MQSLIDNAIYNMEYCDRKHKKIRRVGNITAWIFWIMVILYILNGVLFHNNVLGMVCNIIIWITAGINVLLIILMLLNHKMWKYFSRKEMEYTKELWKQEEEEWKRNWNMQH